MVYYSKSTYYNMNPQVKEYINKKNNIAMYHFVNTFLNSHTFSCLETLLWWVYIATEGPPQNRGFNVNIVMLVSVKWCGSNIFFLLYIKAIWNNCQRWLKQYSIWLDIRIAIKLINNVAIKWIGDPIIENPGSARYTLINILRTTVLFVIYQYMTYTTMK